MLIINDLHLGVRRIAGTTNESATALQRYQFDRLNALLDNCFDHQDLLICGDLFDRFDVDVSVVIEFCDTIKRYWGMSKLGKLFLVAGNHDLSKDSSKISSLHLAYYILDSSFRTQVFLVDEPERISDQVFVIPHLPNQTLFDEALEASLETLPEGVKYLLLHCNYDSPFAVHSDHSLNITKVQADKWVEKGVHILIAHEHQARSFPGVTIMGNQIPSSVSDCLNNAEKFAHLLNVDGSVQKIPVWSAEGSFVQVDWEDTHTVPEDAQFVRVTGKTDYQYAAVLVSEVSRLRKRSKAFVITNAVKIAGAGDDIELTESFEDVRQFDVLNFLYEILDDRQKATIKGLLEKENQNA